MLLTQKTTRLRILDLDVEARPLTFWGERPSIEITAIAYCWHDDLGSMKAWLLGRDDPKEMLVEFAKAYKRADMVTAHNIRYYDLPNLNGAMLEYGLPPLEPKLAHDTYRDMKKRGSIPASQEYLLDLFDVGSKPHMGQAAWREANRLLPKGLEKAYKRVTGDVFDHLRLRPEMIRRDLLKPPKVWRP